MTQLVKVKEVIVQFRHGGVVKFAGIEHKVKMGKAAVKYEYPAARWWTLITQERTRYFASNYGRIVAEMTLIVEVICSPASNGAFKD
jgi:hypothetical protein